MAYGITTRQLAAALETTGILHLKHILGVGVNVKDKDDVPHDTISAARPQALYVIPVVRSITTQAQFKAEHVSAYKGRLVGAMTLTQEREAAGLPVPILLVVRFQTRSHRRQAAQKAGAR